ncbi:MAG TPA: dihydrodipicolinate synthase family protein [Woeseiaceae bacterium]|nr:dihydrodipicolinate synthase family protein [Woeseiaceae bacterium]
MSRPKTRWQGVFPAATTQFAADYAVDVEATQKVQDRLIEDGIDGLVIMGTVGENNSLEREEKLALLRATVEVVDGRVPVVAGVSELTTAHAVDYAVNAAAAGVNGLMVLPAMVYVPTPAELQAHVSAVAKAAAMLPVMLYNNPLTYRVGFAIDDLDQLRDVENIVAIKESEPDTRRVTDIINAFGERFDVFAGLDDVALECLLLGAKGWVSGLTNAFPEESVALFAAARRGDIETAREIYRWFMPLLHLDSAHDLVQGIKLAEQIMGRGSERVRMPRQVLTGARRREVIELVERAAADRPIEACRKATAA